LPYQEENITQLNDSVKGNLVFELNYNYNNPLLAYDYNGFHVRVEETSSSIFQRNYNIYSFFLLDGQTHKINLNPGVYKVFIEFFHYDKFNKLSMQVISKNISFCETSCPFEPIIIEPQKDKKIKFSLNQNRTEMDYVTTITTSPLYFVPFLNLITGPLFVYRSTAKITIE
jgi:hypothetical protein